MLQPKLNRMTVDQVTRGVMSMKTIVKPIVQTLLQNRRNMWSRDYITTYTHTTCLRHRRHCINPDSTFASGGPKRLPDTCPSRHPTDTTSGLTGVGRRCQIRIIKLTAVKRVSILLDAQHLSTYIFNGYCFASTVVLTAPMYISVVQLHWSALQQRVCWFFEYIVNIVFMYRITNCIQKNAFTWPHVVCQDRCVWYILRFDWSSQDICSDYM